MPQGFDNFIGAVGDAIKTAPTFYEDALKPTVQETGKVLALIPQTIEAALLPLRQWNIEREYKFAETKKLLEHKLENVDPEKIVTPEAYVAVPAIQSISYSMDSEELRNLYANLLAKAMNIDTKDQVHPAFVEIIKQMSPIDAKTLQYILNEPEKDIPIIDLIATRPISEEHVEAITLQPNITPMTFDSIKSIAISIENLLRANLIHIDEHEHTDGYDSIYVNKQFKELSKFHEELLPIKYNNIDEIKKTCELSILGQAFCDICIS